MVVKGKKMTTTNGEPTVKRETMESFNRIFNPFNKEDDMTTISGRRVSSDKFYSYLKNSFSEKKEYKSFYDDYSNDWVNKMVERFSVFTVAGIIVGIIKCNSERCSYYIV